MLKISARRLSLALLLGATSLTAAVTARAQTGTDPCPKHVNCTAGSTSPSTTPSTSTASTTSKPATTTSSGSVVTETILVLLGLG